MVAERSDNSYDVDVLLQKRSSSVDVPKQLANMTSCNVVEGAADSPQCASIFFQVAPEDITDLLSVTQQ